jgi:hypothetical protein
LWYFQSFIKLSPYLYLDWLLILLNNSL